MATRRNKVSQRLTDAELEVMQIMWANGRMLVRDILDRMPDPKPSYSTVSTVVRVLEKKGYVSHKAYGTTYEYFPVVEKEAYTKGFMAHVLDNFFGGSVQQMLCFFSQEKSLSVGDLERVMKMMKEDE
ncbi:MAG: BlaI/MecI/CopY family transcriptional regulator [Rikenellaceae bacterium]|nr:BlaI/MecI/CopY family transcriptional regulator [Rikenellaceae bacterium]